MESAKLILIAAFLAGCARSPAIVINAPSACAGADVYIDGKSAGVLVERTYYKWTGWREISSEINRPPRHDALLSISSVPLGMHDLRIEKGNGRIVATFQYRGGNLEVFVPDELAKRWPPSNSAAGADFGPPRW